MSVTITLEGKRKLEAKLEELIGKRSQVAEQIKIAREFGDLSENAEYHAAKEAQDNLETEIEEIQQDLRTAKILRKVDVSSVNIGCKVSLDFNGSKVEYSITGQTESDPSQGKISCDSPIGKALIGKLKGEQVEVKVPAGYLKYKVLDIKESK